MQSQSVVLFKLYKIDRHFSDDLDPHIKGATFWEEYDGSVGYYIFDPLSRSPRAIKYDKDSCQCYIMAGRSVLDMSGAEKGH